MPHSPVQFLLWQCLIVPSLLLLLHPRKMSSPANSKNLISASSLRHKLNSQRLCQWQSPSLLLRMISQSMFFPVMERTLQKQLSRQMLKSPKESPEVLPISSELMNLTSWQNSAWVLPRRKKQSRQKRNLL